MTAMGWRSRVPVPPTSVMVVGPVGVSGVISVQVTVKGLPAATFVSWAGVVTESKFLSWAATRRAAKATMAVNVVKECIM